MKKEYIIGGCIGLVFVIAIIACIVVSKTKKQTAVQYIPTIAKIESLDENGNVIENENKVKLENDDKSKVEEFSNQIKSSAQNERYSIIILADYIVHIDNNISLKFKSNIKEYVALVDETKEGAEKEIVTKAPEGFIDWIMEHVEE